MRIGKLSSNTKTNDRIRLYGHRLKMIRQARGLSRKEIEETHNLSAATLRGWEEGKSEPGFLKLYDYLKIFDNYGCTITLEAFLDLNSPLKFQISNDKQ